MKAIALAIALGVLLVWMTLLFAQNAAKATIERENSQIRALNVQQVVVPHTFRFIKRNPHLEPYQI